MKNELNRRLVLGALSSLVVSSTNAGWAKGGARPPVPSFGANVDAKVKGEALARYAEKFDLGWADGYSRSKVVLFDAAGNKVERAMRQTVLEGASGNKSLFCFLAPAGIRGVSVLMHEHPSASDESWLYLPSSRRVRRVAGANRSASFQGTEFTYEDLSTFQAKRYTWEFVRRDKTLVDGVSTEVEVLKATPNYHDTGYGYLLFSLDLKTAAFVKRDFYDKGGLHLKTLVNSKYKELHGRYYRAHHLEMKNVQNSKRTTLEIEMLMLDLSEYMDEKGNPRAALGEADFTQRALEST